MIFQTCAHCHVVNAGYYKSVPPLKSDHQSRKMRVEGFSSEKTLPPGRWEQALAMHDVLVMTAQILVNVLKADSQRLASVRLLVSTAQSGDQFDTLDSS